MKAIQPLRWYICFLQTGLWATVFLGLTACGGGSSVSSAPSTSITGSIPGTLIPPPTVTGNTVPIVIDTGPAGNAINVAYVAVTICAPNTNATAAACQTIDHVAVDTGSSGLRLLNSSIFSNLSLPAVTNAGGQSFGECSSFAIGTTWGAVRLADIYLAGEVARSVPIQVIGDHPGGVQTVPADCSRTGAIQNTQALLGANGILGVGLFRNDCAGCISPQPAVPATYYSCSATGCVSSSVTASQVVQNPVARFLVDNNGVVITLPAVAGSTNSLSGTLTFGIVIGTQTNNALGNATVYGVNPSGNFTTTYNNTLLAGYIDSGSNAFFFNDPAIPKCTITNTWAYCPSAPLSLSATNQAANGSPSKAAPFSIVNADQLPANVVAANIGAPGNGTFAWGLPFFYGKTVFTAIEGMGAPGGTAPYWAY